MLDSQRCSYCTLSTFVPVTHEMIPFRITNHNPILRCAKNPEHQFCTEWAMPDGLCIGCYLDTQPLPEGLEESHD